MRILMIEQRRTKKKKKLEPLLHSYPEKVKNKASPQPVIAVKIGKRIKKKKDCISLFKISF